MVKSRDVEKYALVLKYVKHLYLQELGVQEMLDWMQEA